MQAVFDGHNDVLLRLWQNARKGSDPVREFVDGIGEGHIDAPRAKAGGLIGGLSAIYVPSGDLILQPPDENGHYETPLSAPLEHLPSLAVATHGCLMYSRTSSSLMPNDTADGSPARSISRTTSITGLPSIQTCPSRPNPSSSSKLRSTRATTSFPAHSAGI